MDDVRDRSGEAAQGAGGPRVVVVDASAFFRAAAIISPEKSSPTTSNAPAFAIANARSPVPVATSSTRGLPSRSAAIANCATRFRHASSRPPVMIRLV